MMEKDGKNCFGVKKMISTSKRHVEHPFGGQNTQQVGVLHLNFSGFSTLGIQYQHLNNRKIQIQDFLDSDMYMFSNHMIQTI